MEQAGTGLEKVVADSLRRMPVGEAITTAWPLVCGSAVAERTRALDFGDGVLRVEVADNRKPAQQGAYPEQGLLRKLAMK